MYLDGYVEEGLIERLEGSEDPTVVSEQVSRNGGTTVIEREHKAVFGFKPGEFAEFAGIQETTL